MNCEACTQSPERLCHGIIATDRPGIYRRCDRLRRETAETMLVEANLPELYDLPGSLDPAAPVTLITATDIQVGTAQVAGLVSAYLLDGQPAVLLHLPACAGRGWEFLRQDLLSPKYIGFLWPGLMAGQDEYREAVFQNILARVHAGGRMAVAVYGEWQPRRPVEAMLKQELESKGVTS